MKLATTDLRLFAAVAETGGITAAAAKLKLSKSLVSRQLLALEERLGTRLVQRTTRKVSLTETGELLAGYARRVVEEMENAEAAIEAIGGAPRGDLKISAPFSVLRFIIIPHLAAFKRLYPEIRLALDASMRIADLVEEGVDVAIRIGELPPSSLVARRLADVQSPLVAAPSYLERRGMPRAPEDLTAHDILNLRADLGNQDWLLKKENGDTAEVRIRPGIAVLDPGLLLDLAVQGHGIAPIPMPYVHQALDSGALTHVLPAFSRGTTPIHAVYPSRKILAPKVRAFVDFVAGLF